MRHIESVIMHAEAGARSLMSRARPLLSYSKGRKVLIDVSLTIFHRASLHTVIELAEQKDSKPFHCYIVSIFNLLILLFDRLLLRVICACSKAVLGAAFLPDEYFNINPQ